MRLWIRKEFQQLFHPPFPPHLPEVLWGFCTTTLGTHSSSERKSRGIQTQLRQFWLGTSKAVKISAGVIEIWKVGWGWKIYFRDSSLTGLASKHWLLVGGCFPCGYLHQATWESTPHGGSLPLSEWSQRQRQNLRCLSQCQEEAVTPYTRALNHSSCVGTLCDPMDCRLSGSSVHGIIPHQKFYITLIF